MQPLSVVISGVLAGTVTPEGSAASTRAGFEYHDDYLAALTPTPLSMTAPLRPGRHEVGVWLEGLVSDNPVVRERWQAEHRTGSTRAVDLLASPLGRDCAGAVQFCPAEHTDEVLSRGGGVRPLPERRVSGIIDRLRKDAAAWSEGPADSAFSLGGAQAKTALRYINGKWLLPYGNEPTTHILKPGAAGFADSDIIEHISQRAAAYLGIDAAHTECVHARRRRALLVSRFDRIEDPAGGFRRIHQEDMCQALAVPAARKYQNKQGPTPAQIAGLLWTRTSDPATDVRLFRDALIYNWIIAAPDAHAKNYGLLIDGDDVRLASLYDVCSGLPYRNIPDQTQISKMTLAMKVGRDYTIFKSDYRGAWERTSHALGLPPDETMDRIETLAAGTLAAATRTIDELPWSLRRSPYVAALVRDLRGRVERCAAAPRRLSPTDPVLPTRRLGMALKTADGSDRDPSDASSEERPVTRQQCSHWGSKANKRCVRTAGHTLPHRYQKRHRKR